MELVTPKQLAEIARTIAHGMELVYNQNVVFMPINYYTKEPGPTDLDKQVWQALSRRDIQRLANYQGRVLFANDAQLSSFEMMLNQFARDEEEASNKLLVSTDKGLQTLDQDGKLRMPMGEFVPNFITVPKNDDPDDIKLVRSTLHGWLDSEDEVTSLLHHFATALAPGWSAVRYVLLLGGGRNGKSVLLKMMERLFGRHNISSITRQQIAQALPVCHELNAKLMNIVYDGKMEYITDSSMEKTLVAGERAQVRMLYESGTTDVQTNALFVEALNQEPKTRDKSSALQKRLSRFQFPNVFDLDLEFEAMMLQDKMVGALFTLLSDHYVRRSEVADKLKPTTSSLEMQVEMQVLNNPMLQFASHLCVQDPAWLKRLTEGGVSVAALAASFMAWRLDEGHNAYNTADVHQMLTNMFHTKRVTSAGRRDLIITAPRGEMAVYLNQLNKETTHAVQSDTVVAGDESVPEPGDDPWGSPSADIW